MCPRLRTGISIPVWSWVREVGKHKFKHCKSFHCPCHEGTVGSRGIVPLILNSTLDTPDWSISCSSHFNTRNEPGYPLNKMLSGPPSRSECFENVLYCLFCFGQNSGKCCIATGLSGGGSTCRQSFYEKISSDKVNKTQVNLTWLQFQRQP